MTQKPKETELEKVKTLLRRLEELPHDALPEQVPPAAGVVRMSTPPEAPLRPRPTLVEPKQPMPEPPAYQPPPQQMPSVDAPTTEAEERGNGRRLLIAGAFAAACAAGFVLARPWDKSQLAPATQRTVMKAPFVTAPSPPSATRQVEVQAAPSAPAAPSASREPAVPPEPGAPADAALTAAVRPPPADTTAAPREPSERAAAASAPVAPAASPRASVVPSPRVPLPDAESPDEELMRTLVKQGSQILLQGQVASARLLFRRAADLGSADAAVQLGDTFDPERLRSLGVRGVSGDLQEAIRWYEKADELGASSAKARLMALSSR